jgi:hypothetical protein
LKRWLLALVLSIPQVCGVTLLSYSRQGNLVSLRCGQGSAAVEWVSPSTFRFRRSWSDPRLDEETAKRDPVEFAIEESSASLSFRTKELLLQVAKDGLLVRVQTANGTALLTDLTEPQKEAGAITWERAAPAGVRYYGFGARDDPKIDARGRRIRALKPFFISTAGYAENHLAPGKYLFDMAASRTDRCRIEIQDAEGIDYYFYYGPSPKAIYEEHSPTAGSFTGFSVEALSLPQLINGSLSGIVSAGFNLAPYEGGKLQIRLLHYVETYAQEAGVGLPIVRALPFQFPKDTEAAKYSDEFMLGDELLVAPLEKSKPRRPVYLPRGQWTNLNTNEQLRGPRVAEVKAAPGELPLFSRDGSVLPLGPLAKTGPMTLHYFPKLPGEFFLFERDAGGFSQLHAAPAGDLLRLEIESRKERDYVWVVHHVERPRKVFKSGQEYPEVRTLAALKAGAWFYDGAKNNLHLCLHVSAREDRSVNLQWQ